MDRKLYRYEYWTEDGGLLTDYAWITSIENAKEEIFGIDGEEKIYKLIRASLYEVDAYHAGYAEGHDVGKLTERIDHDNGIRYEVRFVDVPTETNPDKFETIYTEMFICGVCHEHKAAGEKSGEVAYLGLYGTEWQICLGCNKGAK